MERPSIVSPDMVNDLQQEIASYWKSYKEKEYVDIWLSIDAFRKDQRIGIGREVLLDEKFTDMLSM